ncbi:MAG: phospholipase D-like domain-containing protein [Planctomycetota bacterium]|nr:phospholipase D-like domain-containing protein [Planctomycetota bacterium]
MSRPDIDEILRQTLEDRRLTRGEKRALGEVLKEKELSDSDYAFLRSRAFDIAKEAINHPEAKEVLDWLEDVSKLLTPKEEANSGTLAKSFFSPSDTCPNQIIGLIKSASRSLDICVFTITDNRLSREIIAANERGVNVRVITDNNKAEDRGSDVEELEYKGVNLRVDNTRHHMHHKFAIFDDSIVLTGSYNWTRSAALNNEENFTISDDRRFLKAFRTEFETLWKKFA